MTQEHTRVWRSAQLDKIAKSILYLYQVRRALCLSYSIQIFNYGFCFQSFFLISVPPSIIGETSVPRQVHTTQHSMVTLECKATGNPQPQISWMRDGHPLLLSPRIRLLSADSVLRSVAQKHVVFFLIMQMLD